MLRMNNCSVCIDIQPCTEITTPILLQRDVNKTLRNLLVETKTSARLFQLLITSGIISFVLEAVIS